MKSQFFFKRYELKFLITKEQYYNLMNDIDEYIIEDEYHKSTIYNIYYDTSNDYLIRKSLEKPIYKEKLRIRSYEKMDNNTYVYIELKKKYKDIVYKRRIKKKYLDAINFINSPNPSNQIEKEIDYFLSYYKSLAPKMFLYYERLSYISRSDETLRMTFDNNIIYRNYDLSNKEVFGKTLFGDDKILMEVKTQNVMPLWLVSSLSKNKIYKTSFSKYGECYKKIKIERKMEYGKLV